MFKRVSNRSAQDLLVIAYAFDPTSMVFSHQYRLICKLSEEFKHVFVLANEVDPTAEKPKNVTTLDLKWKPKKKLRNAFYLYQAFFSVYSKCPNFILFSFMTETHSMALGPLTKLMNIRHVLWYAHVSSPLRFRIAKQFVNRIVTSTLESIPPNLKNSNNQVVAIGQMVDDKTFHFNKLRDYGRKYRWIHVGRIDPSKKIEYLIFLFKRHLEKYPSSTFHIIGKSTIGNRDYEGALKSSFSSEIASGQLIFKGKQTQVQIKDILDESDLFIHAFLGSLDKSLIEATMSGITVITQNKAYLKHFGSLKNSPLIEDNAMDFLQSEIDFWYETNANQLELTAVRRSEVARSSHSMNQWIENLVRELTE